ncbi:hypothetical protein MMC13_004698 [Lambiella insularis]|nr:hypothetical protein [Lambiella insularis]
MISVVMTVLAGKDETGLEGAGELDDGTVAAALDDIALDTIFVIVDELDVGTIAAALDETVVDTGFVMVDLNVESTVEMEEVVWIEVTTDAATLEEFEGTTGTDFEDVVEGVMAAAVELVLEEGVTIGTDLVVGVYEGMIHVAVLLAGTELGVDSGTTVDVLAQLKLTL